MLAYAEPLATNTTAGFKHARACISSHIADLADIYKPDVNLCVIKRPIVPEIAHFVGELLQSPTELSLIEHIDFASFNFYSILPQAVHLVGHRAFCADIAKLTALYTDLFGLQQVGLRLRTLDKPMCPKKKESFEYVKFFV